MPIFTKNDKDKKENATYDVNLTMNEMRCLKFAKV